MSLQTLATLLRALQFFAHNAHNQASGCTFFADHKFLGQLYAGYESAYDSIVELIIGDGKEIDLVFVQRNAVEIMADLPDSDAFKTLFKAEKQIQSTADKLCNGEIDQGVLQIIGTIAQDSKVRRYKIGQRIK
jgi:DNA-binding ferritin-like protein